MGGGGNILLHGSTVKYQQVPVAGIPWDLMVTSWIGTWIQLQFCPVWDIYGETGKLKLYPILLIYIGWSILSKFWCIFDNFFILKFLINSSICGNFLKQSYFKQKLRPLVTEAVQPINKPVLPALLPCSDQKRNVFCVSPPPLPFSSKERWKMKFGKWWSEQKQEEGTKTTIENSDLNPQHFIIK